MPEVKQSSGCFFSLVEIFFNAGMTEKKIAGLHRIALLIQSYCLYSMQQPGFAVVLVFSL